MSVFYFPILIIVLLDLNLCPRCLFRCSCLSYVCTSVLGKAACWMCRHLNTEKKIPKPNGRKLWKCTTGDWKQYVHNLHPGISVSSLSGGTVSNVLAYFLAACRCACRASISFLVLGIRHLNIQQSVITNKERRGDNEFI